MPETTTTAPATPRNDAATPATLSVSVELMDDQFRVKAPALSSTLSSGACAVIERPGSGSPQQVNREVFTVDGTGQNLSYFKWDPRSRTGWDQEEIKVGFTITQVLAFHQDGVTVVIAANPLAKPWNGDGSFRVLQRANAATSWQDVTKSCFPVTLGSAPLVNNVGLARDLQGRWYISGYATRNGSSIFSSRFEGGALLSMSIDVSYSNFGPGKVAFFLNYDQYGKPTQFGVNMPTLTYLVIGEDTSTLVVENLTGSGFVLNAQYDLGKLPWPRECRVFTAGPSAPTEILLLTIDGELRLGTLSAAGNAITWRTLEAGAVPKYPAQLKLQPQALTFTHFDLGKNADGVYRIFLADSQKQLWLLRQTGTGADGTATFARAYVPLGNRLQAFACPPTTVEEAELMGVTAAAAPELTHLQQASDSRVWTETKVRLPDQTVGETALSPFYFSEITVLSAAGVPVGSADVEVAAAQRTCIYVDGVSHFIDRKTPLTLRADIEGKVTLVSHADSLSPAPLLVRLPAAGAAGNYQSFTPAANAHYRLSGQDPACPVTPEALVKQGLVTDTATTPDDRDRLAGLVKQVGGKMVNLDGARNGGKPVTFQYQLAAVQPGKWSLDFSSPGRVGVSHGPATGTSGGPDASWLSDFWGDAVHFFKQVVNAVEKIVVEVGDAISVAFNDIHKFVVRTVEEAAQILELVFRKIEAVVGAVVNAVEKIVEWIKMIFSWSHIKAAKDAIQTIVKEFLAADDQLLNQAQTRIVGEFDTLKTYLDDAFKKAEGALAGQKFAQPGTSAPANKLTGSHPLTGSTYRDFHRKNSVRLNYGRTKLAQHTRAVGGGAAAAFPVLAVTPDAAHIDGLAGWLDDVGKRFVNTASADAQKLADALKAVAKDPKEWENIALTTVLQLAKSMIDMVLKDIRDLLNYLFNVARDAFRALGETLAVEVKFLEWLVRLVTGGSEKITWLDLICVVLAIPVSIVYEVVYSSVVPPIASQHVPWSSQKVNPAPGALATSAESTAEVTWDQVSMVVYTTVYALRGTIQTATDVLKVGGESMPREVKVVGSVMSLVTLVCTYPYKQLRMQNPSTAEQLIAAGWVLSLMSLSCRSLLLIPAVEKKDLAKTWLGIANGVLGAGRLGMGIAAAVFIAEGHNKDGNAWKQAELIIKPIPSLVRLLLVAEGLPPEVRAISPITDAICYMAAAAIHPAASNVA